MTARKWTYMLRILRRNPENMPMERMGAYISEFAQLLGTENHPVFKGIKKESTGLQSAIPEKYRHQTKLRLLEARTKPDSRPAKSLKKINEMLGEDKIEDAQLIETPDKVVFCFHGNTKEVEKVERLYQQGSVDGIVTGLVGADDTMHLHLRDHFDRDLKLIVRHDNTARDLLKNFKQGRVRVLAHGIWCRTNTGWIPEVNKCTVDSFELLENTSPKEIWTDLASIPENGWESLEDPISEWKSLRGLH